MSEVSSQRSEIVGSVPAGLLEAIHNARESRQLYWQDKLELGQIAEQLTGREGLLSGKLSGRNGTVVFASDPNSTVERLHVAIGSARVEDYGTNQRADDAPYIAITAWTTEGHEMVTANLNLRGANMELLPLPGTKAE